MADSHSKKKKSEAYYPLPYSFPLRTSFTVTSIVFEHRNVDLGNISAEQQASTNFHSGWDLAVPTGTNFYSICDGTVSNITNTQANDLPFKQSGNSTGNYMMVTCSNGFTAMYWHIQYNILDFHYFVLLQVLYQNSFVYLNFL